MKDGGEIIIFDVDGVLVDVRESFQRTVIETVMHFTGQRVSRGEMQRWKNRSGFNDDWKLTHAWVLRLGGRASFEDVKKKFQEIYWGRANQGNVARERWLLPRPQIARLARRATLAIFTGRTKRELGHTLGRFRVRRFFCSVVTTEDVRRPKPDPEGLRKILGGRPPATAVYAGDNVDDALAARRAGVSFVGVLPRKSLERRIRARRLLELGARVILGEITEIEKWLASERHDRADPAWRKTT